MSKCPGTYFPISTHPHSPKPSPPNNPQKQITEGKATHIITIRAMVRNQHLHALNPILLHAPTRRPACRIIGVGAAVRRPCRDDAVARAARPAVGGATA